MRENEQRRLRWGQEKMEGNRERGMGDSGENGFCRFENKSK